MTEAEWITCSDAATLFRWVATTACQRKLRLYLCGVCRSIQHLFYYPYSMEAVEVAEQFADGLADNKECARAAWAAEVPTFGFAFEEEFCRKYPEDMRQVLPRLVEMGALSESVLSGGAWQVNETVRERLIAAAVIAEWCVLSRISCDSPYRDSCVGKVEWPGRWLVDCVFGNPFRPVMVDPAWLAWNDGTVPQMARAIYEDRRFEDMPILADALEDAGCDDADMLRHCRSQDKHVRGCWAIDRILGNA